MKGVSDFAVVYDISCDKERRRVEKILKGFGFRVQKSVFECRMNKRGKEELIDKLEKEKIKTGFVKLYRLEYSWKSSFTLRVLKPQCLRGHSLDRERKPYVSAHIGVDRLRGHSLDRERKHFLFCTIQEMGLRRYSLDGERKQSIKRKTITCVCLRRHSLDRERKHG